MHKHVCVQSLYHEVDCPHVEGFDNCGLPADAPDHVWGVCRNHRGVCHVELALGAEAGVPESYKAAAVKVADDMIQWKGSVAAAIEHLKRCEGSPYVCGRCGKPATWEESAVFVAGLYCDEHKPHGGRLDPTIARSIAAHFDERTEVVRVLTVQLDNWGAPGCVLRTPRHFLPGGANRAGLLVDGRPCWVTERHCAGDVPEEFFNLVALSRLAQQEGISHLCAANGEIWTSPEEIPADATVVPWREVKDPQPAPTAPFPADWQVEVSTSQAEIRLRFGPAYYGKSYRFAAGALADKLTAMANADPQPWGGSALRYKYFPKSDERVLALIREAEANA